MKRRGGKVEYDFQFSFEGLVILVGCKKVTIPPFTIRLLVGLGVVEDLLHCTRKLRVGEGQRWLHEAVL